MPIRRCLFVALLLGACTATTLAPEPAPGNGQRPVDASADNPRSLAAVMHRLENACKSLDHDLLAAGDLGAAADTAEEAAALIRLGYGEHELPGVPQFARMARDAESWFLQVGLEARQAHGGIAAELFRTGRALHCAKCHDAVDRAMR